MSGVALAVGIGGAVISGSMAADAAQNAAQIQGRAATTASNNTLTATRETNAMVQNQFNQNQQNQSPYMQSGGAANAALMAGLGLGNPYAHNGNGNGNNPTMTPYSGNNGSGAPGGGQQAAVGTTTNAQGQSVDANGNVVAQGNVNYGASQDQMNQAAQAYTTPNGQGLFQQTFKPSDLTLDPSYQFRLQQGQQGLNAAAAANGMAGSGQNLKDISNFNQQGASQEYNNAYNRFMNTQNTQVARLQQMAGVGQNAAAQVGNNGTQTANTMANITMGGVNSSNNYLTGAAAAQAGGIVGATNAFTGAIGNATNNWTNLQMANRFAPQQPAVNTTPTGYAFPDQAAAFNNPANYG